MAKVARASGRVDARSVVRDPLLRPLPFVPVVVALGLRFVLPIVMERVEALLKLDLTPYYNPFGSYILLLLTPMLYGLVVGSLFLDQRDDGTLTALRVTPVPLGSYMAYRLALPVGLSAVMTVVAFVIAGVSDVGIGPLVLCTLLATPLAALGALALAAFAENKVQGFALQKAAGVFLLPPLAIYFLPAGWGLLLGMLPTYWPAKLYLAFQSGDPYVWIYFVVGAAYQVLLGWLLMRRFRRVLSR